MFRTVPLSIIRSFSLYTQQWYMSYRFADSLRAGSVPSRSCSQAVSKSVWHIPLLCVKCKTPDDGQRNCPKHAQFYSKNKFEKLVYLVGFVNKHLSRRTVTWTSNIYHTLRNSRQFCYLQNMKTLNICFIQLCAPWWLGSEARNMLQL